MDHSTAEAELTAPRAADEMFAAVYERLKAMASRRLYRAGESLDTTGLVHELYLRLSENRELNFARPEQFFDYAARAMRHLLIDRARHRLRMKSGGQWRRVTLGTERDELTMAGAEDALALNEALRKLEAEDARAARVVELNYFAGLTLEKIAELMGVTRRTVDRDWRYARAYLQAAMA